ncbi:MAG: hypothetical protein ACXABY_07980 [Candidatus Thorarchaeota archaeon]|jgi:hypothetical protein
MEGNEGFIYHLLLILSDRSELQFFVYLWILVMSVGVFLNDITLKRLRFATFYLIMTLGVLELSYARQYARSIQELQPAITNHAALALLVFVSVAIGLWSAHIINMHGKRQRGWVYLKAKDILDAIADFIEEKIDVVILLKRLSDKMERKANESHPFNNLMKKIDSMPSTPDDVHLAIRKES